jgi:hypothetical protein
MSSSILSYDTAATQSLRAAMGGYPSLLSLPDGMSDPRRIISQMDAADRAFLRAGMSCDGAHREQTLGFHPLLHTFRKSIKTKGARVAWVQALKQDVWDAVCNVQYLQILWLTKLFTRQRL